MRSGGINWLAVIASAVVIYAIGGVIYALLFDDWWMAMAGVTQEEMAANARTPFSIVMPLLTAIFLAVLFKWGNVANLAKGAKWGLVVALASAVPALWYGWVYGSGPAELSLLDSGHVLLGHVAAGAILGGWK